MKKETTLTVTVNKKGGKNDCTRNQNLAMPSQINSAAARRRIGCLRQYRSPLGNERIKTFTNGSAASLTIYRKTIGGNNSMKCEICGHEDRGGVKHQFERAEAAFRKRHPGYTALNERSAIGTALRKRGYRVFYGPGTFVSTIEMAYWTKCSWVNIRTLRRWENGEIA